jgi:hypothetical protein
MKIFLQCFLLFCFLFITSSLAADRYAVASGIWNATSTWSATRGGAPGAAIPTNADNVIIPSPYVVAFDASSKPCFNLTIEYGGTLNQGASGNKLTPRYLNLYGTTLTVNGSFGEPVGCIGVKPYNASTTFTGTPTAFYITRIQPQTGFASLIFDCNVTVTYGGSAWPLTGSSAIYCNGQASTFTINAGKTVTMDTSAYWAVGTSSSSDPTTGANMTINVYGTLNQVVGANSNIGLSNTSGKTTNLHVYSTGIINCGHSMVCYSTGLGTINVTVDAGGSVSFMDASGTCNIGKATTIMNGTWDFNNVSNGGTSGRSLGATASVGGKIRSRDIQLCAVGSAGPYAAGVITLQPGSIVEYYGTSAISGINVSPVENLIVNNSAGISLGADIVVNNTLTLTSGKISLGANKLTAASISGGSTSSYIVTDGTGGLVRNVGVSDISFPVGYTDTYTPVVLNNSGTADDFTVTVKNTFDNAPSPLAVVNKQWTITEGTPTGSNATVKLQWNTADENPLFVRTNPVLIGRFNGSIWEGTSASYTDLGGGLYTASAGGFTAFSPFAVGNETPLPVELASFTSNVNGRDVLLNWETKTEKNSNKFEIERLANLTWVNIGSVKAAVLSNSTKQYSFADKNLQAGKYQYRLKMIDNDGSFNYSIVVETEVALPKTFDLSQNYPNPFNPSTKINYNLASDSKVTLEVYSISGERVALLIDQNQSAGFYSVNFSNKNISSGVYFYRITAVDKISGNQFSSIKKMMLLK